jgi:hypothetical protein
VDEFMNVLQYVRDNVSEETIVIRKSTLKSKKGRKKSRQNFYARYFFKSMYPFKINLTNLCEPPVKTTPQNVQEANEGLFYSKMTLPAAAKHCGMTQKEMQFDIL